MYSRLKLVRHRKTVPTRARKVKWIVLVLTIWISSAAPRAIHVVGVGCWRVSGCNVVHAMVLGGVADIVTGIILGNVGGHGYRRRRCGSGNASHADSGKPAASSGTQGIVTMTVSIVVVGRTSILLPVRPHVFDVFGVEGEVGGVSQETFSVASAHVRSHRNDHDDQRG